MTILNLISFWSILAMVSCSKNSSGITGPAISQPGTQRVVHVSDAVQLKAALSDARPGDDIILADGIYSGRFIIEASRNGTKDSRITLRGNRDAVLDGGSTNTGYVLHLQASYWNIKGISLTNGLKGLMTDGASYNIIDSIKVHMIGEEGIHLRRFSSHNMIRNVEIINVGLKTPDYGEGIYIGSAKSNWATYTNGLPDRCDSNQIFNNRIGPGITAECIDIKEGTTGGIVSENNFDATGISGANSADSWMDVKGNYYKIENNTGFNPGGNIFKDGYQVHVAVSGWGNYNEFRLNHCSVNASGYGFNIQLNGSNGTSTGNKVFTNNVVTGAAGGLTNISPSN